MRWFWLMTPPVLALVIIKEKRVPITVNKSGGGVILAKPALFAKRQNQKTAVLAGQSVKTASRAGVWPDLAKLANQQKNRASNVEALLLCQTRAQR